MTELKEKIEEKREELGIHQFGFLPVSRLVFSEGVRKLCEMNYCGHYGETWACPPGVGTYEECKAKLMTYDNMFVYTTKHELEDSYDFEGMMKGKDRHTEISNKVIAYFRTLVNVKILCLTAEGCNRCNKCTYPDAPCRFPDELFPSVESYGVEVNQIAAATGINYINGENTVTYFGCIFF